MQQGGAAVFLRNLRGPSSPPSAPPSNGLDNLPIEMMD